MNPAQTLIVLLLGPLLISCDDEVCGPEKDVGTTLSATVMQQSIRYENWRSSPNNDCGEPDGPTSLTLEATQSDTNRGFTLCLPRPDKLSGNTFDAADTTRVQVIDVFADLDPDCLVALDRSKANRGTVAFHGVCDDGTFAGGFSLDLQLELPVTITCGADVTDDTFTFTGKVAVSATVL